MKRMSYDEYSDLNKGKGFPCMAKSDYASLDDNDYRELGKALEIEIEENDDDDDDDDDEGEKVEKSETADTDEEPEVSDPADLDPTEEELLKSMEMLFQATDDDEVVASAKRREELAAKAATGKLEKSERDELFQLLDEENTTEEPGDDLSKAFGSDDRVAEAYDASEFLAAFGELLTGRQESLEKSINERDRADALFKRRLVSALDVLAKVVVGNQAETRGAIGDMRKSMDGLASQPIGWAGKTTLSKSELQPSKRDSSGAPTGLLEKSKRVSKRQAEDALGEIMRKADNDDDHERVRVLGHVLATMGVSQRPWQNAKGMTVDLVEEIIRVNDAG